MLVERMEAVSKGFLKEEVFLREERREWVEVEVVGRSWRG